MSSPSPEINFNKKAPKITAKIPINLPTLTKQFGPIKAHIYSVIAPFIEDREFHFKINQKGQFLADYVNV